MGEKYLERIEELESKISELENIITDLESDIDNKDNEISELEEKNSELDNKNTELEEKNDELEDEIYILEKHEQRLFDVDNLENKYKFESFIEYQDKYTSLEFEKLLKNGINR